MKDLLAVQGLRLAFHKKGKNTEILQGIDFSVA